MQRSVKRTRHDTKVSLVLAMASLHSEGEKMIRLRKSRSGGDPEVSKSALEGCTGVDITIVISGEKLDSNITYLGCQVAKMAGRKVHLLHVIVVPRTLPLKAVLTRETEQADYLLNEAM